MKKLISLIVLFSFVLSSIVPPRAYAQALNLPAPGTMVAMSPDYMPVMMKGVKVHPENPLLLDFILDTGKSGLAIDGSEFRSESQKLIKYFLASLTIKEDDLWVNLSPYEKDRMIPEELGKTELGRDMLVQDYVLKQLTASMIYPEKELGKAFWNRVYTRAQEKFGTSDIPVDTFNKVWIVADKAKVFEQNNGAYVVGSHLKVMLESDYEAMSHQKGMAAMEPSPSWGGNGRGEQELTKQVIREVVIPEIEKEVNQGQNFAPLRQMFYTMILASWYKLALKDALLNQVYSNKGKTSGVLSDDPAVKEKIYDQYLQAYKKGVFNYIKDDIDLVSQEPLPRKYFSGGEEFHMLPGILDRSQKTTPDERAAMKTGDLAMITINTVKKAVVAGLIILGIGAFTQTPFAQHFFDVGRDVTPMETVSTAKGVVLPLDTGDIIGKDAIAGFKSVASSSNGYTNLDGSISVEYDAYYSNSTGDIGIRLKGDQFQMVKRSVRTSDDFSGEYRIYRNAKRKEFVLFLKMKKDGVLIIEPGSLKDPYIQQMMSKTDVEPILSLDTGDVVGAEDISKFKYMPAGNGYQNPTEGVSVGYDVYLSKDTKEAGILFHPIVSGNQPGQP